MPWKVTQIVDERMQLVVRAKQGEQVASLAREYGISRKTAYKFIDRYQSLGTEGLKDQPRTPHRQCQRTPDEVVELILAARRQRGWGSKKLRHVLAAKHPGVRFPAPSTMDDILMRHGLVKPRKKRRAMPQSPFPLTQPLSPNDVWAVDYKGQFRLGNGRMCYPLTASDIASRFVLMADALESTETRWARECFERLFSTYGLPSIIRSDNGAPFASSKSLWGLSQLSAFWRSVGIRHERIRPGHPEQNAVHERMHRTLKHETTRPAGHNALQQQERFDRFRRQFNDDRPHEGIEMRHPAELYRPSETTYAPRPLEYPMHDDVLVVRPSGHIRILQRGFFLTSALAGHRVGIREVEDDRFLVTFADLDLGIVDFKDRKFEPFGQPTPSEAA